MVIGHRQNQESMMRNVTRKILFSFLALALVGNFSSFAQPKRFLPDELGINFGFNRHTQLGYSVADIATSYKTGYVAGVIGLWNRSRLIIRSGITLERKGFRISSSTTYFDDQLNPKTGESTESTNLTYITLPLVLRKCLPKAKLIYFEAGLYTSYLLKAQGTTVFSWRPSSTSNVESGFRVFDLGCTTGLGFKKPLNSSINIDLTIFGNYGLLNVNASQGYGGSELHNFSFGSVISITKK